MSKYTPTIGLEIHAELDTKAKMFCGCKNDPYEVRPNQNICPVCTAQPGTLPVINKEAVRKVLLVGSSIGSQLADFTEWDRKNYFYPDIPKGYQISQYKYPLVSGGKINGVELTRIHLEEDTGKSQHDKGDYSLIDYNRAGVPLMELVTEPVIHDAETAVRFAKELQLLLRYLHVSEANMEKGQMRVEANISVSQTEKFGTKVEVKNLNSFKSVGDAINYEIERHIAVLESGGTIAQETRGWDESAGKTFSQRKKETANDYRYFPDPDLPKLIVSEVPELTGLKEDLPELPWEKRARLEKYQLQPVQVEKFVVDQLYGEFFDLVAKKLDGNTKAIQLAANYISSDVAGYCMQAGIEFPAWLTKEPDAAAGAFANLMLMIIANELSSRGAKDVLAMMCVEGGDPKEIATKKGLMQKNDPEALKHIVKEIIVANPSVVSDYRAGKQAALQFLVGQGMKASKGSANPSLLSEMFKTEIG